jgi:hypothetical protein
VPQRKSAWRKPGAFLFGNLKFEIGNWKLEIGNWKLEI